MAKQQPRQHFKPADWDKLCRGLTNASAGLAERGISEEELEDRLDTAVLACWRFGEYAINAALEAVGSKPAKDHTHHDHARDLHASGVLTGLYHEVLEKLGRYRKKADYLSYSRSEPSTHYSRGDLLKVIAKLEQFRREVEELLQSRGML